MKFEKFLLDDYTQTTEGKKVVAFFKDFKNIFFNKQDVFFQFVDSLLEIHVAEASFSLAGDDGKNILAEDDLCSDLKFVNIDEYISFYSNNSEIAESPRESQGNVPFESALQFLESPDFAFPYLFPVHFYKFSEICRIFDIPIPPIPGRNKHLERVNYYYDLCRAMYEFRKQHSLSPLELCVFLYGFAPRFLTKTVEEELPQPNRLYIVGASEDDVRSFMKKAPKDSDVYCWQGNEEMLPGDIVIMYETSPFSRVGSIWRVSSPGYDDPFSYYPGKVFLSHPVKVPFIYFNALLSDPVWGKNGLVKAHMLGVNGRTISHEEYEALKQLFKKKDPSFDLDILPEPPPYSQFFHEDLETEQDVEEQLLEPFLEKLGYNIKKEFTRQFPVRMGRGIRYYPDYALHATGKRGDERADFVWEAKYRIPTQKQLREDFGQAESYAVRLMCKGLGLVSQEGIWLSLQEDHFTFDKLQKYSWSELEDPDVFGKIKTLLYKICKPAQKKGV